MNGGRIVQAGPPREIFNEPETAFVARFIGGHNVLPGGPAGPRPRRGGAARRPRRLPHAAGEGEVGLDAAVALVEYQGTSVQVRLAAPAGGEVQVLLDERRLRRRPGGRGPAGQPELAARRGAPAGGLTPLDQARPRRGNHDALGPRYRVLDRTGGLSRRDVLQRGPARHRRRGREQLPGPVRARRRPDHAALCRHRRERVQGAGRQVQGRYRHHHPVHDADLGRRGQAGGDPADLVRHARFRILDAQEDRAVGQPARHGYQEDQALRRDRADLHQGRAARRRQDLAHRRGADQGELPDRRREPPSSRPTPPST